MRKDQIQGRLGRLAEYGVAVVAAAAMVLPGVAVADGGGGSAGGSGGSGSGVGVVTWIADDDMGAPTVDNIKTQLSARAGISYAGNGRDDGPAATAEAASKAVGECQARYAARYPGQASCRLFAVGVVNTNRQFTGASGGFGQGPWKIAFNTQVANRTFSHEGVTYRTGEKFSDGVTSIDTSVTHGQGFFRIPFFMLPCPL